MTTNQDEFKSTIGLKDVHYAEVTTDTLALFAADAPADLAPAISASAAAAVNNKIQYADDMPFEALTSEGETKVDLELTNLPLAIKAAISGKVYDPTTGRMYDNAGPAPYFALSFRSIKSNGKYVYVQFLKGRFSISGEDKKTKTDTPDPQSVKVTYTAIKTIHQFDLGDINDGVKAVTGDEDADNFSGTTWFDAVQTPDLASVSAVTCTPDPADAAANVLVTKTPTLTFNNAIREDSIVGVSLTRVDTGAAIAITRSLDPTGKILSLAHTASLTANKQYFITVAGVTDIYGQVLADVVYDFTTAA